MSGLAKALRGLRDEPAPRLVPSRPVPAEIPREKVGKSADPDFDRVTIYVRKQTRKLAGRKWEDGDGGDFSDLVEHLLRRYLDGELS